MSLGTDKEISAPPKSRRKFSRADVRFAANELPEHINPFTTQNEGIIENAILANYPALKGDRSKLGRLIAYVQEGMSRAALSSIIPGADNTAVINTFQGIINSMSSNPRGGEAAEVISVAQEATQTVDPAIAENAKRSEETARKQREAAAQIAAEVAAKKTMPDANWHGNTRFDLGKLSNADFLRVLSYLRLKGAKASGSLAELIAAGITYSAAFDEGEYGGSIASRSAEYASAKQVSYMDYGKTWQQAVEQEIQREEWRRQYEDTPVWQQPEHKPVQTEDERIALAKAVEKNPGAVRSQDNIVFVPGQGAWSYVDGIPRQVATKEQLAAGLAEVRSNEQDAKAKGARLLPDGKTLELPNGVQIDSTGRVVVDEAEAKRRQEQRVAKAETEVVAQAIATQARIEGKKVEEITQRDPRYVHADGTLLQDNEAARHREQTQQRDRIVSDLFRRETAKTQAQVGAGEPLPGKPTTMQWLGSYVDKKAWLEYLTKGTASEQEAARLAKLKPDNPIEADAVDKKANSLVNRGINWFYRKTTGLLDPLPANATQEERLAHEKRTHQRAVLGAWIASTVWGGDKTVKQLEIELEAAQREKDKKPQGTLDWLMGRPETEGQKAAREKLELEAAAKAEAQRQEAGSRPQGTWDWLMRRPETDGQKAARERLELEAAAAKAKAATEPGFIGRLFESAEAKAAREAKAATDEINRQMEANRGANVPPKLPEELVAPVKVEPAQAVPVAAVDPKAVPPVAGAPVDPATTAIRATVPEAGDPVQTTEAQRSLMPGALQPNSSRFGALRSPKNMTPIPASTLAAIKQHGAPIAAATQETVAVEQDKGQPKVAETTGPRSETAREEVDRREKDKPAVVSAAVDKQDPPKKVEEAAAAPAATKQEDKKVAEVAPAAPPKKEEEKKVAEATQVKKPAAPAVA